MMLLPPIKKLQVNPHHQLLVLELKQLIKPLNMQPKKVDGN